MPAQKKVVPVIKVWRLPKLSNKGLEMLYNEIHRTMQGLTAFKIRIEDDLIVLFPDDRAPRTAETKVLVEFEDVLDRWMRNQSLLQNLAAALGNAVLKHTQDSAVQVNVSAGDADISASWSSSQIVTREDVRKVYDVAQALLPQMQRTATEKCYCESNALDHKGACVHHNYLAAYEHVVTEGGRILTITDAEEFQPPADVLIANVRKFDATFDLLHSRMNWKPGILDRLAKTKVT